MIAADTGTALSPARDETSARGPSPGVALAAFLGLVLAVWIVAWWSILHPPATKPFAAEDWSQIPVWFRAWARWDGRWYTTIARDGYSYQPGQQSSVAFFPLYALAIRALGVVIGTGDSARVLAGALVTLTAGTGSVVLLRRWTLDRCAGWNLAPNTALTAAALLAIYPYSLFLYGPAYADALFVIGALAAFVLLERDQILAAAIVAALASAVRPVGLVLALALVLRLIERRRFLLRRRDWPIVGAGAGYVGYCTFLWLRFGNPFLFVVVQSAPGWDQPQGWPTVLKLEFFREVQRMPFGPASLGLTLQVTFLLIALGSMPAIVRRFGWAYGFYVAGIAAAPMLGSKDFQGTGRYLLPAFPVFAVIAVGLVRRRILRVMVMTAGVPTLLLFVSWFAKGNYLA